MRPLNTQDNRDCGKVQAFLSDYVDNALSARDVWEVEKHLAACPECAAQAHELQTTVHLLHTMERHDTGTDFMAQLHARLDSLEPPQVRAHPLRDTLQGWLAGLRDPLRLNRLPAFGLGLAMAAAVLFFALNRPVETVSAPVIQAQTISVEPLRRHVALSASNPFDDPVAATLEAQNALHDSDSAVSED